MNCSDYITYTFPSFWVKPGERYRSTGSLVYISYISLTCVWCLHGRLSDIRVLILYVYKHISIRKQINLYSNQVVLFWFFLKNGYTCIFLYKHTKFMLLLCIKVYIIIKMILFLFSYKSVNPFFIFIDCTCLEHIFL